MSWPDDGKRQALTTIVNLESITALLPCPEVSHSAIFLLAQTNGHELSWPGAAYSQANEHLRQFLKVLRFDSSECLWRKGSWNIRIHFLRQLRIRLPWQCDVVMLVGARLNWLLAHGKKGWAADTQFIQLDIEPQEIDSNRPIAVPVVGDIASSMQGMLAELKQNTFTTPLVWRDILNIHKQQNAQKMHEKLSTDTQPLNYFNALSAVRDVLRENQDIYLVNEGANTPDNARNIIDMYKPRRRLDCGPGVSWASVWAMPSVLA
ncbi:hypothetical protein ACLK17_14595 [Escherichia coli]